MSSRKLIASLVVASAIGVAAWLIQLGYRLDLAGFFNAGLILLFLSLFAARRLWRGVVALNVINTVQLLIPLLWVADGIRLLQKSDAPPVPVEARAWSYDVAQGDPELFRNWWRDFVREWSRLFAAIRMVDPTGKTSFKLRPNSEMTFFESHFSVNSLGFRDREFEIQKGDVFRIVAIGESTTMGITMRPEDRPWTVWLEEMIREEELMDRDVQVINAGVAAYTLKDSIGRFEGDLLPLHPDLVISYHGLNGFDDFQGGSVPLPGDSPTRISRPSKTLESLEHAWKLWKLRSHNQQQVLKPDQMESVRKGALETPYGRQYQELAELTARHEIPLALTRFNMAIDRHSPQPVVEFYRRSFYKATFSIQANEIHTELIRVIADENPHVHYIDASKGLDGVYDQFIDLVHFTEEGRERLARNILDGLRPILAGMRR
jgi:lysophospholipase L1-like esterase